MSFSIPLIKLCNNKTLEQWENIRTLTSTQCFLRIRFILPASLYLHASDQITEVKSDTHSQQIPFTRFIAIIIKSEREWLTKRWVSGPCFEKQQFYLLQSADIVCPFIWHFGYQIDVDQSETRREGQSSQFLFINSYVDYSGNVTFAGLFRKIFSLI